MATARRKIEIRAGDFNNWKIILHDNLYSSVLENILYFPTVTEAVGWILKSRPYYDIEYLDGSDVEYEREGTSIRLNV